MSDWFERFGHAEVDDGLITGAYPCDAGDVETLRALGVGRVFNLCEDCEYEEGDRIAVEAALERAGIAEERLELVDYGNLLPGALEQSAQAIVGWLEAGETVYLHCRAGWQRSATVAGAAVALRRNLEPDAALGIIKRRKPSAQPLPHQLDDLWRWWRARQDPARSVREA